MRPKWLFLLPVISMVFFLSVISEAQPWSGIISPSRAVDWRVAGFPGDALPDSSWTQCGSTIAAYSGSAATINNALSACGANHYVFLGPGTFTLSSGIFVGKSNVALRGSGANATSLNFTGSGAGCFGSAVAVEGACQYVNGGEGNVCNWTGGYTQGATSITLANCGSTTPAMGSISNLHVGSILILDQLDEANDPGTIWNCENSGTYTGGTCAGTIQGGESRTNGTCSGGVCARSQQQGVIVTSISGSTIGISPGLYMPNWRSSQLPQAWFASSSITSSGVEDLAIDTGSGGGASAISLGVCNGCWAKGVRSTNAARSHLRFNTSVHSVVRDNYFYKNQTGGSVSYGVEIGGGWNNLIANNIFQQITDSDPSCTGACAGNVIAYNFDIDNAYSGSSYYIVPPLFQHASGDAYNLWEGNIAPGYGADAIHGTHHFETAYRNFLPGWQSQCAGGTCRSQTIPFILAAGSRYFNIVGNVTGQPGYHTTYVCQATTSNNYCAASYQSSGYDKMIYELNYTGPSYTNIHGFCTSVNCGATGNFDPQTSAYLMRWANWDVVTNGTRFDSTEVPTGIALYPNALPGLGNTGAGQSPMPQSFYYPSKPAWFGSATWPLIGPDVAGGDIGMCSGGTYAGMAALSSGQCAGGSLIASWSGHANANPAMRCYLNTMGGSTDGTGGVLNFAADSCYGSSSASQGPLPPQNLTSTVH
jgi:hypothetical protein